MAEIFLAFFLGFFHPPIVADGVELQVYCASGFELSTFVKSIKREISEYQRCLDNSLGCGVCQWIKKNTSKGKHVAQRKDQLVDMLSILADPGVSEAQKIIAIWSFLGTIKAFAQFRGEAGRNFLETMERLEREFQRCQNVIWGRL